MPLKKYFFKQHFAQSKEASILFYLLFASLLTLPSCQNTHIREQTIKNNISITGTFEGTEPFWGLKLNNNQYELSIINETLKGSFIFSKKSERGASYAFKDGPIYGVINKSFTTCEYAITEDSTSYEIFLSYKGITYQGCGNITVKP